MWWVPTFSLTLQKESGALLVEVMTCLIHVPQIIGLWVSGGPVRRKHENLNIPLTTSFRHLYHHGCLITQNSNVLQMTVLICGLLTVTVGSLVCRLLLVRCMFCASTFLSTHIIIATTARQRLELALTAMRLLERHPIDERRLSRLCAADSDLSAIVELHVDFDVFDSISVPPHVLERLADTVLVETPARPDILSDPAEGFRGHRQHESTLQSLKRLKQGMPLAVNELWDAHNGNFVDDTASMAKFIQDAAQDRPPLHGQNLLDQWYANFSQCRVIVERHEIANIILDSPNGKKPGPDGLPAAFLRRYCHQLAIIFQEAWIELASGCAPIDHVRMCLGFKKWIMVPKMEGANTIDKLRDLELGNEVSKVLAQMLFKVLDEVCQHESHGLCNAQQAFVTGRDIIRNTTMLCRNFWAAHEEDAEGDDPYLLLALDCSKGYNRMDRSWLQRCLPAALTPPEILAILESLLINMPVLILDGVDFAPLHLASGLTQGCPGSNML